MYSNIIIYQKYLVTSIKVRCTTRSLYASSGPKVEGVPTYNEGGGDGDQDPVDSEEVLTSSFIYV